MDLNTLEKNVTLLPTPYCDFSVSDEEGNAVIFDIMESPEKTPRVYIDNDSRKEKIVPSSMCEGKTLRIYTKNLEIKRNYYINTSVELEFRDSDERLFTYGLTVKDYTLAVSFPNPNEDVKDLVDYSEDHFSFYNIEVDNGDYILRLFDRDREYIDIFVFWIWNIQNHMIDYETTCDVSTWWCR